MLGGTLTERRSPRYRERTLECSIAPAQQIRNTRNQNLVRQCAAPWALRRSYGIPVSVHHDLESQPGVRQYNQRVETRGVAFIRPARFLPDKRGPPAGSELRCDIGGGGEGPAIDEHNQFTEEGLARRLLLSDTWMEG